MSRSSSERRYDAARAALVLASLLFHGWAMDRMPLVVLVSVALVAGLAAGWRPKPNRDAVVILTAVAAFLGGSDLIVEPTPDGAIPSVLLSPLSLVLVVHTVAFTLARRTTSSWTLALLLVVVSCTVPPRNPLNLVGPITAVVVLVAVPAMAWRGAWRWDRAIAVAAALGLTAAGAGGLTMANAWAEGLLMPMMESWASQYSFGLGLNLQPGVSLRPVSSAPDSKRVLMELEGPAPRTLRTQVMDRFDGDHWSSSEAIARGREARAPADGPRLPLEITFFARLPGVVPTPAGLTAIDGEAPSFDQGWLVQGGGGRGELLSLERSTWEGLPWESGPPGPINLEIPEELAEDLAPWAERIAGEADGTEAKARAIERYLQSHHDYAAAVNLQGHAHPLVVLLEEQRPASCGYFASAMAAMLRSQGVHARLAGGFAPREHNPWTGKTTVRKRDAHAWVEVWIPERSAWMAFDPTPASAAPTAPASVATGMLEAARAAMHRLLVRLQGHPDEVLEQALGSWPTIAIVGLVTLLFGWRWVHKQLAAGGFRRERGARDRKLWPHYRRFLRILRRRGIRHDPSEPDEALLARIGERLGDEVRAAAEGFLVGYRRARFGGGSDTGLQRDLTSLARLARRHPPQTLSSKANSLLVSSSSVRPLLPSP